MKEVVKKEVIEATCDICGENCMKDLFIPTELDEDDIKEFEGMELNAVWGYASNNKDGEIWEAVVCEKCVDEHLAPLIKFFKRPYL